jgi:GNAT superfamily N-acetyltransferase
MSELPPLRLRPIRPDDAEALAALFEAAHAPCHCRYWHFPGDKNEWLERCYVRPEENRAEMAASLDPDREDGLGVVAELAVDPVDPPARSIVGWCKVARAPAIAKAYEQRFYRGLDCFDGDRATTYLVGCVLVHPAHRRRGLSSRLVDAARALVASLGGTAIEAFPRRVSAEVADGELWLGPAPSFERCGFRVVGGEDPYPVLRHDLVPTSRVVGRRGGGT